MRENKSVNWINAVKAVSIIAVFFVHCQSYYDYELGLVNTFFFVGGYQFFRKCGCGQDYIYQWRSVCR